MRQVLLSHQLHLLNQLQLRVERAKEDIGQARGLLAAKEKEEADRLQNFPMQNLHLGQQGGDRWRNSQETIPRLQARQQPQEQARGGEWRWQSQRTDAQWHA
jgi:hypothetical protein